ncbi:MAG: T9SS type A sorting domain-containing protein [Flavobacteriaceae bacterium]|nr:T9SS type A sorting domain-containing protein [Flavobacteriaceae bacterium]
MKKEISLLGVFFIFLYSNLSFTQSLVSAGDIAFIAFNADGDKDFALVALADIPTNSTIYITDDETTGVGSPSALAGSEGTITWSTGTSIIRAGTVVIFTDIDNASNPNFGVNIGSITRSGSFGISGSKDGLIAFIGVDANNPTTYISALQIGNDASTLGPFDGDGTTLTNTGLKIGTTITVIDNVASPDGGKYTGSRSNQVNYASYKTLITNKNNWTTVSSSGDGETLLDYSKEAFTIHTTNWTGNTDADWNTLGNWDNGIPTINSLVIIPEVTNAPIISATSGAISGNITIVESEGIIINSKGSLLVNGTTSGTITYTIDISDSNWHLVSSPVVGEQYDNLWVTNNNIFASTTPGKTDNRAIGVYANAPDTDGQWSYFQNGGATTTFNSGQGYAIKRTASGLLNFTGTYPTTNTNPVITIGQQGTINENTWNFVGNPFPSYINIANLLTNNATNLDDAAEAVYVWNGSNYQALTTGYLAPGQGFFVSSSALSAKLAIATNLQSHQTGITFYKATTHPTVSLHLSDTKNNAFTTIHYIEKKTSGLDPRFDLRTFGAANKDLQIFTHLVSDNTGIDFMTQTLPNKNYENYNIPIGIRIKKQHQYTFSINHNNLPKDLMVFLEDKKKQTIIRIDNKNYTIPLDTNDTGVGRFYLRTSTTDLSKTLHTTKNSLDQIRIYLTSKENLRIVGLNDNNTSIILYNILGKIVFKKQLKMNRSKDILIPTALKKGIYIVKIQTTYGNISKKIIIK